MIEVESVRRVYQIGHYEPGIMGGHPLAGPPVVPAPPDKHNVLVHWNHSNQGSTQGSSPGSRSDEDEDEDDEYRPFTPPPPRERLSYTRYQLELLNGIYIEVRYPNSTQKQLIAKRVGITREQVKIWFQNRRRKDVVGNSGKSKSCDVSSSSNTSKDSADEKLADDSSSDDSASSKDAEESVVPSEVLKGVVGELFRYTKDPLKGKKNRKKAKSKKQNEKQAIKKGLATTLLAAQYDMVSPPNQVIPSAFFEKVKKGFNHSKGLSAFAVPRDPTNPAQISSISSTTREPGSLTVSSGIGNAPSNSVTVSNHLHNKLLSNRSLGNYPYSGQTGHFIHNTLPTIQTNGCDLPVLSDLLSYKSAMDSRHKGIMSTAGQGHRLPNTTTSAPSTTSDTDRNIRHHSINSYNSGMPVRPMGGIFPFPFLAEQPMILSSLRQPDQIYRPSPQYPVPHYNEDPYQPLIISSLSNPYYAPPPPAWTNQNKPAANPTTFTQL